jgi:hypothetical protein
MQSDKRGSSFANEFENELESGLEDNRETRARRLGTADWRSFFTRDIN